MKEIKTVGIVGAGTMGAGIAQVCAAAGYRLQLVDRNAEMLGKALGGIRNNLNNLVEKGKISAAIRESTLEKITTVSSLEDLQADLIIEAIVENLEAKRTLLAQLQNLNPTAILASNTSTFPITQVSSQLSQPALCAGLHFFNPPTLMKLVEIISAKQTSSDVIETLQHFCTKLGKVAVHAKDSPGFIVNRVARPYYVEALKAVEDGIATFETVDVLMKSAGFKMGPFELMDLIGIDVNLAVTTSLYESFDRAVRFKPSEIQQDKVKQGKLGRKTGGGFYDYTNH